MLTFLLFCLLTLPTVPASRPPESTPPELTAAPQGKAGTAVSALPDDIDSLVLPDGTPLRIKVAKGFSSENAKAGDVIDFVVAFEVCAGGVVAIPQRTALAGKVVSVSRSRRGARDGDVKVALFCGRTRRQGERLTEGAPHYFGRAVSRPYIKQSLCYPY
jgi:hypothetical protein